MGKVGGEGRGERGLRQHSSLEAKVTKGWVIKMSGLYRAEPLGEGHPSPWAWDFRVKGVCMPEIPCNK